MNRDIFDRWSERGILFAVLGILVFGPLATGAVDTLEFLVIQCMTVVAMLLWCVRLWVSPRPQLLWPPLCWVVVAFAAYAAARYLTADIEYIARREFIRILVYSFLFLIIVNNLHRQESTQIISFTMIVLAAGISCYAIYQFLTGSEYVWYFLKPDIYKGRAGGTYICPNHLAGFVEMLLPLAVSYTLLGRGRVLTKVLLGYAALLMAAGIGVTVSRAGWASCGVAMLVLFGVLATQRSRRLPALALMLVLVGCGIMFLAKAQPIQSRFSQGGDETDYAGKKLTDLNLRYELWEVALRMWRENPWFGVGPGHYDARFRAYRPFRVQMQPDRAHNEYLNTLADWGGVGALIIVAGMGILFIGVLKTWPHVRRSEVEKGAGLSNKFAFVLGAAAGLLALALHSVLDYNMQVPANAILAVTLAALLASHLRFTTERFWTNARMAKRVALSTALVAGICYLSWQEVRLGGEYLKIRQALHESTFSPEQAKALEKAFAIEPNNPKTAYSIGESYRMRSFEGGGNYRELALEAMEWFARGIQLNPYDGYNYLRYGMCLDWVERFDEAGPYYNRADALDPSGYYMNAYIGWHYVQIGDYAAAREWFQRSAFLKTSENEMAAPYLGICERKLLQRASNQASPFAR
jgi:O-antigen ligase